MINAETSSLGNGIAIGLSSSFFGFYTHASFMAELHDQGIFPSQVAGTSSGSLVAVLCGMGLKSNQLEEFVMQKGMRSCFADWAAPLRFPGVASSLYSSGILSGNNVVKFLRSRFNAARLENLANPSVQVAVTNLTRKESHVVDKGDAAEWVTASCSIPGMFCNRIIDGERWCDGGVAIHVPFDHWLGDPSIHTIVLHCIDHEPGTELVTKWPTLSTGLAASHETICKVTTDLRMQLAKIAGKRVITINTETPHPGLFPTKQRVKLLAEGRLAGKRTVEAIKKALAEAVA